MTHNAQVPHLCLQVARWNETDYIGDETIGKWEVKTLEESLVGSQHPLTPHACMPYQESAAWAHEEEAMAGVL